MLSRVDGSYREEYPALPEVVHFRFAPPATAAGPFQNPLVARTICGSGRILAQSSERWSNHLGRLPTPSWIQCSHGPSAGRRGGAR
jgi:hypothetical protein